MAEVEIVQNLVCPDGTARLVLKGHWRSDYFNIRDDAAEGDVLDIVLTPKSVVDGKPPAGSQHT